MSETERLRRLSEALRDLADRIEGSIAISPHEVHRLASDADSVARRLAPAPAGDSGGERCANYKPPMTCLTAPSSEAGRCDFCRVEAADFARSPR